MNEPKVNSVQQRFEHQLFQHIFEHAADGYIILNDRFEILYMNRTARTWFGDSPMFQTVHCNELLRCHDNQGRSLQESGCYGHCVLLSRSSLSNVEMNVKNEENETLAVSVTYSCIPDESQPGGRLILMSIRDITSAKKMEQERRKVEELQYTLRERERLARDLHDTLAQDLAFVNMQIKMLANRADITETSIMEDALKNISEVLDQCLIELRQTLRDLNFSGGDLKTFLQDTLATLKMRTGIQTRFQIEGSLDGISEQVITQVARLIKESLNNVRKHAHATQVDVLIQRQSDHLRIIVSDNGKGFDPDQVDTKHHFGLRSIRERCKSINGSAVLDTAIGKGTTWTFTIPMQHSMISNS
jgi:PAS domain S-box-containing protein